MSNATKLAVLALSATVIGLGLWSALDGTPAASTGPAATIEPDEVGLAPPESPANAAGRAGEARGGDGEVGVAAGEAHGRSGAGGALDGRRERFEGVGPQQ